MPIANLFSRRHRKPAAALSYDVVPEMLRHQLVRVFARACGSTSTVTNALDEAFAQERPLVSFGIQHNTRWDEAPPIVFQCITDGNLEECLDAIDAACQFINAVVRDLPGHHRSGYGVAQDADSALNEVNARMLEAGVGYQFSLTENQLVRVDSGHLHREAVEPAMRLLAAPGFEGAQEEFARAHRHHRDGAGKEAIVCAVSALESTAKAICDARGWEYDPKKATAKPLLDVLFAHQLVPQDLEAHFGGLRGALESGLPTIGNRMARHGQGSTVRPIDEHVVALGMHLCASAIVFLIEAHRAKP